MANIYVGQGSTVNFSNDAFSLDNQTVDCVTSIDLPDAETEQVEATCIESQVKTFVSSRQTDFGEFTFDYNWDPNDATHALLDSRRDSGEEQDWKVTIPPQGSQAQTTELAFKGVITANNTNPFSATDVLSKTCTVKVNTAVTITTS